MNTIQQKAADSIRKQETVNATTTAVASRDVFVQILEENKSQISKALAGQIDLDRFVRMAMTSISKNPSLRNCTPNSLLGCVIQAGQLSLELGNSLGHAYPVPYKNKKTGKLEAQFIIGYQGYIELIMRTKQVKTVYAQAVKKNDEFDYQYGTDPYLRHKPATTDRGETIGFYAVAQMTNGGWVFEYMSKDQVDRIRLQSPGKDSDMWKYNYDEGGRKTVIRRLQKYLPKTGELARAEQLDDLASSGVSQELDVTKINDAGSIDIPEPPPPGQVQDANYSDVIQEAQITPASATPAGPPPASEPLETKDTEEVVGRLKEEVTNAKTHKDLNVCLVSVSKELRAGSISTTTWTDLTKLIKERNDAIKPRPNASTSRRTGRPVQG